ncbi:hypothetical protein [uncultured Alistipes sp.]|uniref:hypothetical protein n=1 Tax=uncultured Alistipes sp. TaxID=538949 RepID=UPI0025A9CB21|nr:hypothetical protein [uncultured Alistipes sp.]
MKKLLSLFACLVLLFGCNDSPYSEERGEKQQAIVEALMKAVNNYLLVLSATPIENGYVITFSDNSQITILNSTDESIHVTQDDDNVYFELSDGSVITIPKRGKAPSNDIILFEDTIAHDICVNLWDTNNDGQLSYAEAAAVKSIGMVFKGKEIVNFKEFQYFTGVTAIEASAFYGCSKLTKIGIPKIFSRLGTMHSGVTL